MWKHPMQPAAPLTLHSQLQHQAHPYTQGVHRLLHPDGLPWLQESASEEKTSETGGLQKGNLELVLQQKGERLLLSSSHQQKNKHKHPVWPPWETALEQTHGEDPEQSRMRTCSPAPAAQGRRSVLAAYHVLNPRKQPGAPRRVSV